MTACDSFGFSPWYSEETVQVVSTPPLEVMMQ